MDTSHLEADTLVHIRRIAELKGITEQEAMTAVLNIYAKKYASMVERAITAAELAKTNYNK